eukprot:11457063-Karenia_brevis.AAC.1
MLKAWEENGFNGSKFDYAVTPTQNILTRSGFFEALDQALQVEAGGASPAGPPCSLWVFMSASIHKRTKAFPGGDDT